MVAPSAGQHMPEAASVFQEGATPTFSVVRVALASIPKLHCSKTVANYREKNLVFCQKASCGGVE